MNYFVYLLLTKSNDKLISYVGYSNNLSKRLLLHNNSKGAKFTRGRLWTLIYKKKYKSKSKALIEEHSLKKNYKLRSLIKKNYVKKNKNFYTSTL